MPLNTVIRSQRIHLIDVEEVDQIEAADAGPHADPAKRPESGTGALGSGAPGCNVRIIFKSCGWKICIVPMLCLGIGFSSGVCITGLYHSVSA